MKYFSFGTRCVSLTKSSISGFPHFKNILYLYVLGRNRVKKRIGCVPNLFLVGHNKQLRKNEFCPGGFAFKGLSISALRPKK